MPTCAVLNCKNRTYKKHQLQADKEKMETKCITFHVFPTSPNSKNAWLVNIGRKDWFPMKHSRVCSQHFVQNDFIKIGKKTFLKKDAVPMKCEPAPVEKLFYNVVNVRPASNLIEPKFEPIECGNYKSVPCCSDIQSNSDVQFAYSNGYHQDTLKEDDCDPLQNCISSGGGADHEYVDFEVLEGKQNSPSYSKFQMKITRKDTVTATSISPLRQCHCRLSTNVDVLVNKHQLEKVKLRRKIRTLQKSKNYYVKKVADLLTVIRELKSNENKKVDPLDYSNFFLHKRNVRGLVKTKMD